MPDNTPNTAHGKRLEAMTLLAGAIASLLKAQRLLLAADEEES